MTLRWRRANGNAPFPSSATVNLQSRAMRTCFESAIENVIRNAVYYTHPGTEILIELNPPAEAAEKMIALNVSDRGPGVPEEDLEKIFKPFYRVAEARDRQSGGAGLGLAIASRVITMHRGRIMAGNREGGGLEVRIELPQSGS